MSKPTPEQYKRDKALIKQRLRESRVVPPKLSNLTEAELIRDKPRTIPDLPTEDTVEQ